MGLTQEGSTVKLATHQEDTMYILSPPGALTYLPVDELGTLNVGSTDVFNP